eukprot:CAMPEP_0116024346 /NCGR_PEP_ID=MMETSP0321-20121206/12251_1 /TAXON_ID=163516 /ORGANISM="Leptocylindrus danicus var. danicus, Strain B650" /LENGTH=1140 /DNA_ID=CAMNT_0003496037 /DNA_START=68 /DNA_END=3490 /DNA_ORIENTATION=+
MIFSLATTGTAAAEGALSKTDFENQMQYRFLHPAGSISEEAQCNVEELEEANDTQLHAILQQLAKTSFFRTFFVDLDHGCPLISFGSSKMKEKDHHGSTADAEEEEEEEEDEFECSGGKDELDEDAEPLCTVDTGGAPGSGAFGAPDFFSSAALSNIQQQSSWESESQERTFSWKDPSDPIVVNGDLMTTVQSCGDDELPDTFWLDMCSQIKEGNAKVVNLALNPERNTQYNGTHIWNAIYEENCINFDGDDSEMCFEERVLYRLLSGLHTSTTLSIAKKYYPPSKRKGRDTWEPNPQYFMEKFSGHPEYIRNLHFSYVVLLRALRRASPFLYDYPISSGNILDDEAASMLIKRLLDSHILQSCSSVFSAFDETLMFESATAETGYTLQENFKGVFHNVSSILDCVQCQQCKLHGKMTMLGYGAALKILLTPEELISTSLTRNEIVAFINTIAKMSESMKEVRELAHLYFLESEKFVSELPVPDPKEINTFYGDDPYRHVDRAVAAISELARTERISADRENELIALAFAKDPALLILAKHYYTDLSKFLEHSKNIAGLADVSDEEPDAIVVGSGLAGLAASLKILDRGGRVILIEKEHRVGGNSAKASSGINACCPNESKYDDSLESFKNDTVNSAGSSANLPLIETLVGRSAEAVGFLKERAGVDLSLLAQLGGHSHKRTHRPSNGMAGAEIIYAMQKAVKKFEKDGKIKIMVDTKATKLVQENGSVVGLEYTTEKADDSPESGVLRAPNVILATGGFAADRTDNSFLAKHRPELLSMAATAGDFSTGDGISMATELGAGTVDLAKVQIHPTGWVDPKDPTNPSKVLAAELMRGVGGILVNDSGQRFCNELGTRAYVADMMLKHNSIYAETGVWDKGSNVPTFSLILASSAAEDGKKHVDLYSHKGLLMKLEGVDALASWMNVDASTIQSTLIQYKNDDSNGIDKWGKTSYRGVPTENLNNETFYAGTVTPVLHYCMGGITIDTEGNVLDEKLNVIPGLHAAGEVTGGVHGDNRLGGNSLLECTVYGTLVGEKIPVRTRTKSSAVSAAKDSHTSKAAESSYLREISMEEVSTHNTPEDCWVAIHGEVYDLTLFAEEHPPGAESIYELAGKDGTEAFHAVHNKGLLDDFQEDKIGILKI